MSLNLVQDLVLGLEVVLQGALDSGAIVAQVALEGSLPGVGPNVARHFRVTGAPLAAIRTRYSHQGFDRRDIFVSSGSLFSVRIAGHLGKRGVQS